MAWWPFAVRPTTAGNLMVGTNCPARACRRWPMPTAWPTKSIIMPGSSWTTCTRPTPVWWVTGSHTSSIYMTSPSFIWDRTSLTRTPASGPSASMPITSSCSRTPGTCPRSPTWTSKCTLAAMASWQLPSRTPSYMELTSTRQCLRNFACTTPYFLMKTFLRHLHTGPPPGPEEVGRSVAAKTTKGPPLFTNMHSPWQQQPVQQKSTNTALAVSNSANDGPQQQQQQCQPHHHSANDYSSGMATTPQQPQQSNDARPDPTMWSPATFTGTQMPYVSWTRHSPRSASSW